MSSLASILSSSYGLCTYECQLPTATPIGPWRENFILKTNIKWNARLSPGGGGGGGVTLIVKYSGHMPVIHITCTACIRCTNLVTVNLLIIGGNSLEFNQPQEVVTAAMVKGLVEEVRKVQEEVMKGQDEIKQEVRKGQQEIKEDVRKGKYATQKDMKAIQKGLTHSVASLQEDLQRRDKASETVRQPAELDEQAIRDLLKKVSEWNRIKDVSKCERNLYKLRQAKSLNPQAWPDLFLSKTPVQEYLKWVVHVGHGHNLEAVQQLVQFIFEPSDLKAVKQFPGEQQIIDWLYRRKCQDSPEMVVYSQLDSKLGQWSHELGSKILNLQTTLENEVHSCEMKQLDDAKRRTTRQLNEKIDEFQKDLLKKTGEFIEKHEHADIMINWKAQSEDNLRQLCKKQRNQIEEYCNTLIHNRRAQESLENLHNDMYKRIQKPVKDLVMSVKGRIILKEEELRTAFNEMWEEQKDEMKFKKIDASFVEQSIESIIKELFGKKNEMINSKLSKHSLKHAPKQLTFERDHVVVPTFTKIITETTKHCVEQETANFVKEAEEYLAEICGKSQQYKVALASDALYLVTFEVDKFNERKKPTFLFTEEYKIDLCIVVGGIALRKFEEMIERNDPSTIMETLREPSYIKFRNQALQRKVEVGLAESLSFSLKNPVRTAVIDSLVPLLKDQVTLLDYRFQSKYALLYNIMLDLEKKRSFKDYALHLTNVEMSMRAWIKVYTMEYCTAREGGQTRLERLACIQLEKNIMLLVSAAEDVNATNPNTLEEWVTRFQDQLKLKFHLSLDRLLEDTGVRVHMAQLKEEYKPDFKNLTEIFLKELENLEKELAQTFSDLHKEMEKWKRRPYDIIAEDMIGCSKQCPFCKAKCEYINPDHPGDHRVSIHRPQCLGGFRWSESEVIILDSCTDLMRGDGTFRNKNTNDKPHPYKNYRDIYKDWLIVPNSSRYDSSYWKYFVTHFTDEIFEYFGAKKPPTGSAGDKTLQEWKKLEWDKVKKDLKESFGL